MIYVVMSRNTAKSMRGGIIITDRDVAVLRANHDVFVVDSIDLPEKAGLINIPDHMINWGTGKIMLPFIERATKQRVAMYLSQLVNQKCEVKNDMA